MHPGSETPVADPSIEHLKQMAEQGAAIPPRQALTLISKYEAQERMRWQNANSLSKAVRRAEKSDAALRRIRELHQAEPVTAETLQCLGCGHQYPCPTITAIDPS